MVAQKGIYDGLMFMVYFMGFDQERKSIMSLPSQEFNQEWNCITLIGVFPIPPLFPHHEQHILFPILATAVRQAYL
jgi:hypothetical protein